jgi:catechol 2,3-dioxygenase-like lactoylglutathione lyase family enzyme
MSTEALDSLLASFEAGRLTRRQCLVAIAALGTSSAAAAQPAPGVVRARTLHHVNLQVADVARSEDFYRRLFGFGPSRPLTGNAHGFDLPGLAHTHISLQKGDTPGRLDHFCIGIEDFDAARITTTLRSAGLGNGLQVAGNSAYVRDPDGIRVQIAPFDREV